MAVLKYRDPGTQEWAALSAIQGPAGPAGATGPTGPAGPAGAGGLDQTTADSLYVNIAGDTMTGALEATSFAASAGTVWLDAGGTIGMKHNAATSSIDFVIG